MKKELKIFAIASLLTTSILIPTAMADNTVTHKVQRGDSLYLLAKKYDTTIGQIMEKNEMHRTTIYIGESLEIDANSNQYTVRKGDTLYLISKRYGTTVKDLKAINNLKSDMILIGQSLTIPHAAFKVGIDSSKENNSNLITYVVQPGDTANSIAEKFGNQYAPADIMKYNYISHNDWFDAGETITINGYAPRNYDVKPNEATKSSRYGTAADWFKDTQYIVKRGKTIKITDTSTGKTFNMKVMGGYNHADVEPVTANDTKIMKSLFKEWTWNPRPVSIFVDGINIAASLSGKPHSFDTIAGNNVTGHFDLYMKNSKPHNINTDSKYVAQHQENIKKSTAK
ncbi:MAG: LysM peptidoglycan-binding domain-containing protein [Lysinibacillus sp.]|nr:LysM peptidoglycan-binding domain-containing protein [Lysinibacillus sp.]